jgi:hypothetical protein
MSRALALETGMIRSHVECTQFGVIEWSMFWLLGEVWSCCRSLVS